MKLLRALIAEYFGTMIFVFTGSMVILHSIVLGGGTGYADTNLMIVALGHGLILATIVSQYSL